MHITSSDFYSTLILDLFYLIFWSSEWKWHGRGVISCMLCTKGLCFISLSLQELLNSNSFGMPICNDVWMWIPPRICACWGDCLEKWLFFNQKVHYAKRKMQSRASDSENIPMVVNENLPDFVRVRLTWSFYPLIHEWWHVPSRVSNCGENTVLE